MLLALLPIVMTKNLSSHQGPVMFIVFVILQEEVLGTLLQPLGLEVPEALKTGMSSAASARRRSSASFGVLSRETSYVSLLSMHLTNLIKNGQTSFHMIIGSTNLSVDHSIYIFIKSIKHITFLYFSMHHNLKYFNQSTVATLLLSDMKVPYRYLSSGTGYY